MSRYLLAILFLLPSFTLAAQCPYGEISLTTQAAVDAFKTTYPNCEHLNGSLEIRGASITSIDSLEVIRSIKGNLDIRLTSLTDVDVFTQLNYVGGTFEISVNGSLESIGPFPSLTSAYDFYFSLNNNLTEIDFGQVNNVYEDIEFFSNPSLTAVNFGSLVETGGLSFRFCAQITNLNGFANLQNVKSSLSFRDIGITDLTGLSKLETVENFSLIENSQLTNLSGCPLFTQFKRQILLSYNPLLTDISAFNTLTETGTSIRFFKQCQSGIMQSNLYLRLFK